MILILGLHRHHGGGGQITSTQWIIGGCVLVAIVLGVGALVFLIDHWKSKRWHNALKRSK